MGRHCEICETHEAECDDPRVHLSRTEAGKRVVQEMLYGRMVEQRLSDLEKGREAMKRERESVMEAGAEREAARAAGAAYARKQAAAREARIMGQVCDICWRVREECEWPEVHFSRRPEWIAHCNEVLFVMQQEQGKADDAAGRERKVWDVGDRLAEGEGKERAVEEGLRWAKQHAAAYEARCLLEPEAKATLAASGELAEATLAEVTAARIASGELVEARYVEGGVENAGKLWVEKREVEAGIQAGTWRLTGVGGVDVEMCRPSPATAPAAVQQLMVRWGAEKMRVAGTLAALRAGAAEHVEKDEVGEPAEHVDKKRKK